MKKMLGAALVAALSCGAGNAAIIQYEFSAASYSGTFSVDGATYALEAFNLDLGNGHVFDLTNTAILYPFGTSSSGEPIALVYGTLGSTAVSSSTYDFYFRYNTVTDVQAFTQSFTYAVGGNINSAALDISRVSPSAAVPEPASWAMFIGGFGLVGATMRRRKLAVKFA